MSKRLATHVAVYDEQGVVHSFGPDDDVPQWAAAKIGDHCYTGPATAPGGAPARAGKGSSREAWAEFCTGNGVDVSDGDTRDDLIAKAEQAGLVEAEK